jgi:integrase
MNYDEDLQRMLSTDAPGNAPWRPRDTAPFDEPPDLAGRQLPGQGPIEGAGQPQLREGPPLLVFAAKGFGPGRKRAGKYYGEQELSHVLDRIERFSRVPESDAVKVLATYRGGLRTSEVAGLTRRTLVTSTGEVRDELQVMASTSKRSKPRTIPMHPQLKAACERLFEAHPDAERVAFSRVTEDGYQYQTADALYLWYPALYLGAGLIGCTGMSGRRSFATNLARYAPLPLVQQALGHARLSTTGIYVVPTGDLLAAINAMGSE